MNTNYMLITTLLVRMPQFRESESEEEVPEPTLEECLASATLEELEEAEV
jgi:hypothetical protein